MESGLPRATVELNAIDYNRFILEVMTILDPASCLIWSILKSQVMIPTYYNLMSMGKSP